MAGGVLIEGVRHFLEYGYIAQRETPRFQSAPLMDTRQAVQAVRETLIRNMEKYKDKAGVLLSCGLDSSILLALSGESRAYTIAIEDRIQINDLHVLLERYPVIHKEIQVSRDKLPQALKEVVRFMRVPFADASAGLLYEAFKQIKDRQLVTGNGADELFGGDGEAIHTNLPEEMAFLHKFYDGCGKQFCTPFLEGDMLQLSSQILDGLKRGNLSKKILRLAFVKYLPKKILLKKKQYSLVPYEWYLNEDIIDSIKQSSFSGYLGDNTSKELFRLAVLALWEEKHGTTGII